ncbi:hypothetical protein ABK040_007197 [Willaertia magna]
MKHHTLLLVQYAGITTRTYYDYETTFEMAEGVCRLFEKNLKRINQKTRIKYSISDINKWIDDLADISCLVLKDPESKAYIPHDKEYIKRKVYKHFEMMANQKREESSSSSSSSRSYRNKY